jgi:hypothetical protein
MNPKPRPFWLPASNYYVLAAAVTAAFFFIVWGAMSDGSDAMPLITAGISSSILMISAVVLREVILRRSVRRQAMQQSLHHPARHHQQNGREKLTLEQNNYLVQQIRKKSEAANILNKMADGHREVFELCSNYLNRNEVELRTVGANSPRLAALLKSRTTVSEFHRHHMLRWAEISSQTLASAAGALEDPDERITAATDAITVMDMALASYPSEKSLIQTQELLQELVVSIRVADWFQQAERASAAGDHSGARSLLREALFYLGRDNVHTDQRRVAASRIQAELERLRTVDDVR